MFWLNPCPFHCFGLSPWLLKKTKHKQYVLNSTNRLLLHLLSFACIHCESKWDKYTNKLVLVEYCITSWSTFQIKYGYSDKYHHVGIVSGEKKIINKVCNLKIQSLSTFIIDRILIENNLLNKYFYYPAQLGTVQIKSGTSTNKIYIVMLIV